MNRLVGNAARVALIVAIPATLAGCGINTIPTQDEATKTAWAEVQNQYQRRADLVPNLVATVKGYAAQEKDVLTAVTQARASATQVKVDASTITDPAQFQKFAAAQDQLSGVLGRLMVVQERYPELKSNQNFLALQSQLEGTENRIAIARRDYNETAQKYNTTLRTFPSILWAKTVYSGQKPAQLFQATAAAQSAPTVDFSTPPTAAPPKVQYSVNIRSSPPKRGPKPSLTVSRGVAVAKPAWVPALAGMSGFLVALVMAMVVALPALAAPKFPPLTGRVVDGAQILSPDVERDLTDKLETLETTTGRQLVVATVPDLQGYPIEDYGYQLGRAWGIGQKDKDDGVILLVAPNERKVRIEVGYGLEPVLTDALSSVIIQSAILPKFRDGDMEGGIVAGTNALVEQLSLPADQAKARVEQASQPERHKAQGSPIVGFLIFLFVIFVFSSLFRGRRGRGGLGSALPWIILGALNDSGRGGGGGGGGGFSGGGGSFGGGGSSGAGEMATSISPQDLDRIAGAVARAEKTTAGEIFCVLAPEVSDYRETPLVWAAATALVLPAAALFAGFRPEMLTRLFGGWSIGHASALDGAILSALSTYIALQLAVFVAAALLVSIPPVRRALTPASLKAARVRRAAMEQFLSHGLHVTRDRTGVLIFAALAERRVEVIADEGIYKAAPDTVWDQVVADLVGGLKAGKIADGFVAAVARAGAILSEHVPPRGDDRNELPDGLTILPKR